MKNKGNSFEIFNDSFNDKVYCQVRNKVDDQLNIEIYDQLNIEIYAQFIDQCFSAV